MARICCCNITSSINIRIETADGPRCPIPAIRACRRMADASLASTVGAPEDTMGLVDTQRRAPSTFASASRIVWLLGRML